MSFEKTNDRGEILKWRAWGLQGVAGYKCERGHGFSIAQSCSHTEGEACQVEAQALCNAEEVEC